MFGKTAIQGMVFLGILLLTAVSVNAAIWTEPSAYDFNIVEGCAATNPLRIGNNGPGNLTFKVQTHIVGGSGGVSVGIDRVSALGKTPLRQDLSFTVKSDVVHKPDELIVRFAPKQGGKELDTQEKQGILSPLKGAGIKREFKLVPGLSVVKLPAGMTVEEGLATLKKTSGVLYAHPNYRVNALSTLPNDTRFSELWGMHNTGQDGGTIDADIDAPEAWDIGTGSRDIVVAVIDTGVDYTHPDLASNMWVNQAEYFGTPGVDDDHNGYIDDIYGYDFVNNDGDPMDDHFHGTHCAGTIGAIGNNGVGVAGVCWNVKIMAIKFLDAGGSGWTDDAISSVEYSIQMGANLSSNSWGGGGFDQGLKDAIDAAGEAGMLFVAAAGNSDSDNDQSPHYPSSYTSPSLISVMATDRYDNKSDFSCYGLISVDIGAPGTDILSCQPGGGYQYLSGTSMATPHVSGACALLWSMNPELTNSEVKDILLRTVDPTLPGLCVSGGRLNLYNAICETKAPWITIEPDHGTISPGQSVELSTTFSAMELAPETYQAEIVVVSNDPVNPRKAIPVTMTVNPDDLVVTPGEGFESVGSKGGPFEPRQTTYRLTNNGSNPLNWTTLMTEEWLKAAPVNWLTVIPSGGILGPHSSIDVNVFINAYADTLDPNTYSQFLTFKNLDSGSTKPRLAVLTVKPPDLFTESCEAGVQAGLCLTLRPNGSIACYEACRDMVNAFPTEPNGGAYLPLGDDDYAAVVLAEGKQVRFYNGLYDRFYVGSNGYITFGGGDSEYEGTLENHFSMPRISGYFTDLTPATSQSISYKQLEDRVTVTFLDVPIFGDKTAKNSFQIEMFFIDGTIRLTWMKIADAAGIAGISEGKGLPPELFEESKLSGYPICWPLGDFNKNYVVEMGDLGIFVSHWLDEGCGYPLWCDRTDLDYSSAVAGADFSIFAENWRCVKSTLPPPIAWWKFDEGTGTVAYDSAGNNDGQLMNGPVWTTGQIDGALSFDGVNDYVTVADNASQQIKTNQITLSAWIWLAADVGNTQRRVICKQETNARCWGLEIGGAGYAGLTGNQVVFHDSSGTSAHNCISQTNLIPGRWYHIGVSDNGGEIRLYINGLLNVSSDDGYGIPAQIASPINIGKTNPESTFFFNGVIDDVRIYNQALSAEEIEELYRQGQSLKASNPNPADSETGVEPNAAINWSPGRDAVSHDVYFGTDFNEVNDADVHNPDVYMGNQDVNIWDTSSYDSNGLEPDTMFYWRIDEVGSAVTTKGDVWSFRTYVVPNLISWWKFDEGTGTVAHDSASGHDGQLINGPSWTGGQINGALGFDGVNDYVEMGDTVKSDLNTNYTVSAWIRTDTLTGNHQIAAYRDSQTTGGQPPLIFQLDQADAGVRFIVADNYGHILFATYSNALTTGTWYHVAGVRSGNTLNIYVNAISGTPATGTLTGTINSDNLKIGALLVHGLPVTFFFDGVIDDVRIYDAALTAEEIEGLYREGQSLKASNPNPADGKTGVEMNAALSWSPGRDAVSHDVYFGTNFDEVNDADVHNPDVYMGNQDVNFWDTSSYDSNGLEPDTMFYWRIDEVGSAVTTKGDVWSFRTYVVPNLISWWKFDEGTGTIAYDSAGSNNGNISGATWTSGPLNGALGFDGINDYIEINDNESLRLTANYTIALWIYRNAYTATHERIIAKSGTMPGTDHDYWFQITNDRLQAGIINASNAMSYLGGSVVIETGRWYFIGAVYDGSSFKLYIDGALTDAGRTSGPGGNAKQTTKNLQIGRLISGGVWYYSFNGTMDDVRIYNRILSDEEFQELYRQGISDKASNPNPADGKTGVDPNAMLSWSPGREAVSHDVYFGTDFDEVNDADVHDPDVYMGNQDVNIWDTSSYDSNGLEPGNMFYWRIDEVGSAITTKGDIWSFTTTAGIEVNLISWWKFDEGTGTVANDSAGNNDGQLMDGPVWTTGQIGGALIFDGTNDYVTVADDASQQIKTNQITLSAWIKLAANVGNTQRRIICKQQNNYIAWGFEIFGNGFAGSTGNQLVFHDTSGTASYACLSTTNLGINQWYHVAVTDNAGKIRIYINGLLDKSSDSGYGIPAQIASPINIGKINPETTFFFNGTIDEVRFYNRALSAEEILEIYQSGL